MKELSLNLRQSEKAKRTLIKERNRLFTEENTTVTLAKLDEDAVVEKYGKK